MYHLYLEILSHNAKPISSQNWHPSISKSKPQWSVFLKSGNFIWFKDFIFCVIFFISDTNVNEATILNWSMPSFGKLWPTVFWKLINVEDAQVVESRMLKPKSPQFKSTQRRTWLYPPKNQTVLTLITNSEPNNREHAHISNLSKNKLRRLNKTLLQYFSCEQHKEHILEITAAIHTTTINALLTV